MLLPSFTNGLLPKGIHSAPWEEVVQRFGGNSQRKWLLDGFVRGARILGAHGCKAIFLDGSFATDSEQPNDFDACWDTTGVSLAKLRMVEPVFFDFSAKRAAQKIKYRGEFFPARITEDRSGKTFLEFFQIDRHSGGPKGIVLIKPGEINDQE